MVGSVYLDRLCTIKRIQEIMGHSDDSGLWIVTLPYKQQKWYDTHKV